MNQIPINQEHLEALQETVNKDRENFIKTLNEEELKKFKAVEQAVNILVENKVWFYLFPMLKTEVGDHIIDAVWQWNSITTFTEYGENGKISEKSKKTNEYFHAAMIYQLITLMGLFGSNGSKDYKSVLSDMEKSFIAFKFYIDKLKETKDYNAT